MQPNNVPTPEPATTPMNPGGDIVFKDKPKKNTGMITGMIILALLAAGGIGFGVWGLLNLQNNNEQKCVSDNTENISEEVDIDLNEGNTVSKELAQNLIDPYLVSLRYGVNIFDQDFNETNKAEVAYRNLDSYAKGDWVFYDSFNEKYQYLFGNDEELAKTNYQLAYDILTYNPDSNNFKVDVGGGGGTGIYIVNVMKNVSSAENNIIVDMYHDNVPVCSEDSSNSDYCMTNESYNDLESWIEEHQDKVPTYTMTFIINNGHYVLNNISKN